MPGIGSGLGHIHFTDEVRGAVFGKLLPALEDLRVDIDNLRAEIADLRSEVEALKQQKPFLTRFGRSLGRRHPETQSGGTGNFIWLVRPTNLYFFEFEKWRGGLPKRRVAKRDLGNVKF